MLFHAALNAFTKFFLADLQGSPYQAAWWALAVLTAAVAAAVVWYAGSRSLVRGDVRTPYERPTPARYAASKQG